MNDDEFYDSTSGQKICQLRGGPSESLEQAREESSVGFGGGLAKSGGLRRRLFNVWMKPNLMNGWTIDVVEPPCKWFGGNILGRDASDEIALPTFFLRRTE